MACSQQKENDLEMVGLKGPVVQVLEKTYGARMENQELSKWEMRTIDEYYYNEEGYVQQYFYHVPNRLFSEFNYYNEEGHPINYIVVRGEDTTVVNCEYRLTPEGLLAEERYLLDNKQTSRYTHAYEDDRIVETQSFNHDDQLDVTRNFSYTEEGVQDTVRSYGDDGSLRQYVVKKFKGKWLVLSSVFVVDEDGSDRLAMTSGYEHFDFDEQGNWNRAHRFTTNKMRDTTVYEIVEREITYRD
jgi:hypothetical protein